MRALTYDEIRDTVYARIAEIFPDVPVLDLGSHTAFRGRDFVEIELPVVTYSLSYRPNFSRVVETWEEKDIPNLTATLEELIPYDIVLTIGCHSDLLKEAEELALRVQRNLGRAPCIGEIGFCLVDTTYGGAFDLTGVYSFTFRYEGWARLPGPKDTVPLIREVVLPLKPCFSEGGEEIDEIRAEP